ERLVEIDRTLLVLRRDLAQLAPGAVTLGPEVFSFLRAEGEGLARQDLRLEAGRLLRVLRAEEGGSVDQRLLGGVAGARWRLLDRGGRWRDSWPPAGQSEAEAPGAPPVAAELTLRLDAPGQAEAADLVRLFALPGAAQR
ncbi:type II secretion system protein GspJ, partial [Roseivivax sp. GX 12232]|uniref:type II secretion system protein GspJ n=1 Tax=Roseivivax sp. GX 12232 TaxID=2900547 RepID=UPI001E45EE6A